MPAASKRVRNKCASSGLLNVAIVFTWCEQSPNETELGLSCRNVHTSNNLALTQLPAPMNSLDDESLFNVAGPLALLAMVHQDGVGALDVNAVNRMGCAASPRELRLSQR